MKPAIVLFAVAATGMFSAPSSAQDSPSPPPKPVKEKKICRRSPVTGSMMESSECHTAVQWAAIDQQNAEANDVFRDQQQASPRH